MGIPAGRRKPGRRLRTDRGCQPVRGRRQPGASAAAINPPQQSVAQALSEALGHKSYVLLVLGFFTCGFQIFFIAVHMPSYLVDRGLPAYVGGWTLATVGLFNIFGAIIAGWLAGFVPSDISSRSSISAARWRS